MEIKCIFVGKTGVGKTSILRKCKNLPFMEKINSTHGLDYISDKFERNGKDIILQIWDTAGQERYQSISSKYYKGASGVFLAISAESTCQQMIETIGQTMKRLWQAWQPKCVFVLINKMDLVDSNALKEGLAKLESEINVLQKAYKISKILFVSAKENQHENMRAILYQMVEEILEVSTKQAAEKANQSAITIVSTKPRERLSDKPIKINKQKVSKSKKCCSK